MDVKKILNSIFPFSETTTSQEREIIVQVVVLLVVFAICMGTAILILPENCQLFGSNASGPFDCDGFTVNDPDPCRTCRNKGMALVAQIIAGLGVLTLLLPLIIPLLRTRFNEPPSISK